MEPRHLWIAVHDGQVEVVDALIKAGCDVNKAEVYVAAEMGHSAVAEALIKAGCDVDKVDNDGDTTLSVAAQNGHI